MSRTKLALAIVAATMTLLLAWWFVERAESDDEPWQAVTLAPTNAHDDPGRLDGALARAQASPLTEFDPLERTPISLGVQRALTIRALDPEGEAVAGLQLSAQVALTTTPYDLESVAHLIPLGVTNSIGELVIQPAPSTACSLRSMSPNWIVVGSSVLAASTSGSVELRVRECGAVTGEIYGGDGPVPGAVIGALTTRAWLGAAEDDQGPLPGIFDPGNTQRAVADAQGRFTITGMLPGSDRLDVLADGFAPLQHELGRGPQAGEILDVGRLHLHDGLHVVFRVLDEQGPVSDGTLMLEGLGSEVTRGSAGLPLDAEGEAVLRGASAGARKWTLHQPSRLPCSGRVTIPSDGGAVVIDVPQSRSLVVTAQDREGRPIERFSLRAREDGSRSESFAAASTHELHRSAETPVHLFAEAEGFTPSPRVIAAPTQRTVALTLERPGSLELDIRTDAASARIGLLPDARSRLLSLVEEGVSPVELFAHRLAGGPVQLDEVAAEKQWVIVEVSGSLEAFGPFDVQPGVRTTALLTPSSPLYVTGVVRDARTGEGVAGVEIRQSTHGPLSSPIQALIGTLAIADRTTEHTDEWGSFRVPLHPEQVTVLTFLKQGYLPFTARIEPAASSAELGIELEAFPATQIRALLANGRPASGAALSFIQEASERDLGSRPPIDVTADQDGKARVTLAPQTTYTVAAKAVTPDGLTYRVRRSGVAGDANGGLTLELLPNHGWLTATPDLTELRTRGMSVGGDEIAVEWEPGDSASRLAEIPISAGEHRIEGRRGSQRVFAVVHVAEAEHVTIPWDNQTGTLSVDLLGAEWRSASLRLVCREGAFSGYVRHAELDGASPAPITALPEGRYSITLLGWTDPSGRTTELDWTQRAVIGATPATLLYEVGTEKTVQLRVVAPNGDGLGGATVECFYGGSALASHALTHTNPSGLATLIIPADCDDVVLRIVQGSRAGLTFRFPSQSPPQQLTLRYPSDGTLAVSVDAHLPSAGLAVELVPDAGSNSALESDVVQRNLSHVTRALANIAPGDTLTLETVPTGTYTVRAFVDSREVFTTRVRVEADEASRVHITDTQ